MKFYHLSFHYNGSFFRFNRFTGALHTTPNCSFSTERIGEGLAAGKISRALTFCDDPYRLPPRRIFQLDLLKDSSTPLRGKAEAIDVAFRLVRMCQWQFLLAFVYASLRKPLFNSAAEAIGFFRSHVPGEQSMMCLPRALFAAKTSRCFAEEGVVLIGVFLPLRSLHAWVMEGDSLADQEDGAWINFRPVGVIG